MNEQKRMRKLIEPEPITFDQKLKHNPTLSLSLSINDLLIKWNLMPLRIGDPPHSKIHLVFILESNKLVPPIESVSVKASHSAYSRRPVSPS